MLNRTSIAHLVISPIEKPVSLQRLLLDHFEKNSNYLSPTCYYNRNCVAVEISYDALNKEEVEKHFSYGGKNERYDVIWIMIEIGDSLDKRIKVPTEKN